jgi:site-specific DNA-methyltransferase (adenine-specific)
MTEPVRIGDATLYLGDCREVMASFPACFRVDAVITDPPYGLAGSSGTINERRKKAIYDNGRTDTLEDVRTVYVPAVRLALSLAKRGAVTPGTPHSFEYPKPDDIGAIFQPAVQGMSKWGRPTWQPILFYGRDPRLGLTIKDLTFKSNGQHEKSEHPCPKPDDLMAWLVDRVALAGETVLDPFMGTGTTGVHCIRLRRSFVGIELEPKYFDIACRRIEQAYAQRPLFASEPAKAPQQLGLEAA